MPGYHAKKRLGQNFLVTDDIIKKIVDVINPGPDDVIIEIGSGRGALTIPIVESGCTFLGVEFDRDLIGYLEKLLRQHNNATIRNMDFLKLVPAPDEYESFTLVGNIPYNLSSPVIEWIIKYKKQVERVILVVQKEIAERVTALPGSRDWSPLSIFTQLYFNSIFHFDVSPVHFRPAPKVTSAVLELKRKEDNHLENIDLFERLVKASFKQRRKLMINNLVPEIIADQDMAMRVFAKMEIDLKIRAEELSLEQFLELTECLIDYKIG